MWLWAWQHKHVVLGNHALLASNQYDDGGDGGGSGDGGNDDDGGGDGGGGGGGGGGDGGGGGGDYRFHLVDGTVLTSALRIHTMTDGAFHF